MITSVPIFLNRHIPHSIRDRVWVRDKVRCQFRDGETGRFCNSTLHLQVDQRYPFGLGGGQKVDNLRLLCSNHNRLKLRKLLSSGGNQNSVFLIDYLENLGIKAMTGTIKTIQKADGMGSAVPRRS